MPAGSVAESAAAVEVEMPQSLCHMHGVSLPQPFDVNEFLREDERAPFAEFKQRMSDQTALDDMTLLRFLRADACKLDKSEARLRATLAWRTARNVDAAIDNPPRHSAEYQRLRHPTKVGTADDSKLVPPPFQPTWPGLAEVSAHFTLVGLRT